MNDLTNTRTNASVHVFFCASVDFLCDRRYVDGSFCHIINHFRESCTKGSVEGYGMVMDETFAQLWDNIG